MMNQKKLSDWSRQYLAGLREHVHAGRATSAPNGAALRLGRAAVGLGLETLELARIHEQALTQLETNTGRSFRTKLAERFFTEVNQPIEESHHAARPTRQQLQRLQESLQQRTQELAATNRKLQRGVVRRKSAEAALKKSGEHYTKLLQDARHLQDGLRELTHRVLTAQEVERQKISRELQDEIVQTLLGINVRLLTLKQESQHHTRGLKNEIASAEQLVVSSARSVRQFARKLDPSQPGSGNRSHATRRG